MRAARKMIEQACRPSAPSGGENAGLCPLPEGAGRGRQRADPAVVNARACGDDHAIQALACRPRRLRRGRAHSGRGSSPARRHCQRLRRQARHGGRTGAGRSRGDDRRRARASSHADLAARADLIVSAVTASQAVPVARSCAPAAEAGRLVPRLQLGLARRQAARRQADRRRRRTLCRGRGDDLDPALPHQGAAAARRQRRGAS